MGGIARIRHREPQGRDARRRGGRHSGWRLHRPPVSSTPRRHSACWPTVSWPLRRAGGTDGLALVPDLATTLPRPTDGGRTYTFTLRSGIRYSNGVRVAAGGHPPRTCARALRGPGAGFYAGIVGAKDCIASAAHCALTDGVLTHHGSPDVVVRLTDPDPEFLYKLSEFVYAAAPGVPVGESRTPIPSTGPYMIANYRKGEKELTLVRNPYFTAVVLRRTSGRVPRRHQVQGRTSRQQAIRRRAHRTRRRAGLLLQFVSASDGRRHRSPAPGATALRLRPGAFLRMVGHHLPAVQRRAGAPGTQPRRRQERSGRLDRRQRTQGSGLPVPAAQLPRVPARTVPTPATRTSAAATTGRTSPPHAGSSPRPTPPGCRYQ